MPKRGRSHIVRLTGPAVVALKAHKATQNEERLQIGSLWQEIGLVFTPEKGTALDVGIFPSFRPLLKRAGLHRVRFHDLRHTCATLVLSKNVNPKIGQQMLAHANISETMDTYSHVLPSIQESAVSAIESAPS